MIQQTVNLNGYKYVKLTYSYASDKELIEKIIKKATKLSGVVNPHSPDGRLRTQDVTFNKLLGGLIAETAFLSYIEEQSKEKGIKFSVIESSFSQEEDLAKLGFNQVDLKIEVAGVVKEIEIRSSYSYKTTLERLFGFPLINGRGAFSIIGWYSSKNKPMEVKKDYYIFAIHQYLPSETQGRVYANIDVYLAGAASKQTLEISGVNSSLKQEGAMFRVINPLNSVADPVAVINEILN
jgi:hypothetical protein